MARAIWTGSISFGLVNIPVGLYVATRSHQLAFHQFDPDSGQRIHYKRVAEQSEREVPYENISKGFEFEKGRYVLLDPKELEAIEPKKSKSIDIEQFVSLAEIDPIVYNQTYYVGPSEGQGARRGYALLRHAMKETNKIAIGRFVMRTKEYLAAVRPLGPGLALETMFYPDEIRDQREVPNLPESEEEDLPKREVGLATQLIDALTARWDHHQYKDTYRERVLSLVEQKAHGEKIVQPGPVERPTPVVDLMEALRKSLGQAENEDKKERPRAARERRPPRRREPRARSAR